LDGRPFSHLPGQALTSADLEGLYRDGESALVDQDQAAKLFFSGCAAKSFSGAFVNGRTEVEAVIRPSDKIMINMSPFAYFATLRLSLLHIP
jgi:hypothetical protein